ncbi:hypothetical protein Hypma_013019 [Hypsizygus marmoreus]|uniref:NADAR domain-containing protein n=1 Tax=Hypsizygus marmoreus TaxID=39966 RepID=A0A369JDJ3_HYPMA|nr:hypothetical protein Hypma_013019 [Hypsizygus marmoreus]
MGLSSSKTKSKHDPQLTASYGFGPYGVPPRFGPGPPPNFGQGPMSNQGPVFPPGFVPQYPQMPQSQPYWPIPEQPQKRRKTRKRKEPRIAHSSSGHAQAPVQPPLQVQPGPPYSSNTPAPLATFPTPQPGPSTRRRAQTPFPRAVSVDTSDDPSQAPPRRGPTPFVRPAHIPSPDSQDDDEPRATQQPRVGHIGDSRSSPMPPPPFSNTQHNTNPGDLSFGRGPLAPSTGAPAPNLFSSTLARNPLPSPPRDIYATTPYRPLLQLPQAIPHSTVLGTDSLPLSSGSDQISNEGTKKAKKGLFRAFSTKRSEPKESKPQNVQYVPVYFSLPGHAPPGPNAPRLPAHPIPAPPPNAPSAPNGSDPSAHMQNAQFNPPVPERPVPEPTGPPLYFNQDTDLAPLLNHSPHRVIYKEKIYATAAHLVEAMKFMTTYPELAERIRECKEVAQVYPLSSKAWSRADKDWSSKFLQVMEDVAYLKVRQHPDLRALMKNTGNRPLVYDDDLDAYWGIGPNGNGQNALGHIMERVRVRLDEVGQKKLDQTAPSPDVPLRSF